MFNNKLTPWKHWGTDRNYYSTYLYRTKVLCKLNITGSRRPLPNETTWVNIKLRWHDTLNREYSIPLTTAWSVKPSWSKMHFTTSSFQPKWAVFSSDRAGLRRPPGVPSARAPPLLDPDTCLPLAVPVSVSPPVPFSSLSAHVLALF